jgi:hypothetical protein
MSEWSKFAGAGTSATSPHRDEPLPVEAVRDLLGVARALYLARKEHGAGRAELERLALAGRRLRHALALVELPGPNNLSAAWFQAEQAVADLAGSVDALTPAEWIVEASAKRVGAKR